jgi:hypothetical protein
MLLDYGDNLDKEFPIQWFSYTGSNHKTRRPWHWKNCTISFEKISKNTIRFIVRRKKNIYLPENTKLRWDQKYESNSSLSSYTLNYIIHFDVQIISLPNMINDEEIAEQLNDEPEYGQKKDSWVINLDSHHKIWQWKNNDYNTKNVMITILDSINKMQNDEYLSLTKVKQRIEDYKITKILPVVYHPTRDLREGRNYIQEIHLHKSKTNNNKIMITIVYNDEQLRENKWLDLLYRGVRKLRHGRTFDVETFNIILDENEKPTNFDFPNIYSGLNNKLEKDSIHYNACNLAIRYYFNQNQFLPILFINTSNHAMAELDNNCNKWKIEYRLWEEECPIYIGTNSRCEIEGYIAKYALENFFIRCKDSKFLLCIKKKRQLSIHDANT